MASKFQCRVVGLGGYNSIITNNGMTLVPPAGLEIVTGNHFTAASALKRLYENISNFREKVVVGIVGASGNIGSVLTEEIISRNDLFKKAILFIRNKSLIELHERKIENIKDHVNTSLVDDLSYLKECSVILVATNTSSPIIFKEHLACTKPVVLMDVSVPQAISQDLAQMNNIKILNLSSYITLPDDPNFVISSLLPQGTIYCCAAETILYALEKLDISLRGYISLPKVKYLISLGEKNGFFANMGRGLTF